MLKYREQVKERAGDTAILPATTSTTRPTAIPAYASLAEQYGLEDMQFGPAEDDRGQTVEQEYQAYVTAALSKPGTDMLKFWEVRRFYQQIILY